MSIVSKNAKDIRVNPLEGFHTNKNKTQNILRKSWCTKVSKKATSERMLPHCFARSYIQFHLKKKVSWHLSTSTGKWPCRRRRRCAVLPPPSLSRWN